MRYRCMITIIIYKSGYGALNGTTGLISETYDNGLDQDPPRRPSRLHDIWLLSAVLVLLTCALVYRISRAGEFSYTEDEAHHAVTGVYFADFLRDLPLTHPVQYTYQYYARYPALGLIHWPPFFHFCEGVLFRVAGPSLLLARITVVLFALVGASFWFLLMRELVNARAAVFATLALAFAPAVLVYEQSVMLEVPSLALCIAASYFWLHVLRDGTRRQYTIFAVFFLLAMFTKQQSAYMLPFCLLTILAERKWSLFTDRFNLVIGAIGAALLGALVVLTVFVHRASVADHIEIRLADPLYYLRALPGQFGWPMLLMCIAGIVLSPWWSSKRNTTFMLLWILATFLAIAFLAAKSERYTIYWVPAFLYFASWPFAIKWPDKLWARGAVPTIAALVLLATGWVAWRIPYPYITGFGNAAAALTHADPQGGVVLYDGYWNGNFVFEMRLRDTQRKFVVLTKGLYAMRITLAFGAEELAHNEAQIQELLSAYGIRYLVLTEQPDYEFPIQEKLREVVQTPQFRLVQRIPAVSSVYPYVSGIRIYENLQAGPPAAKSLRLRMMTLSNDLEVPLSDLGIR